MPGVLATTLFAASGFAIIFNIALHLQVNLHCPLARFGLLYIVGGGVAFAGLRLSGRVIDRLGGQ